MWVKGQIYVLNKEGMKAKITLNSAKECLITS